jgi:hypothetical protein
MRSRGFPDLDGFLPMLTGLKAMKSDNFMFEAIAFLACFRLSQAATATPEVLRLLQKLEL